MTFKSDLKVQAAVAAIAALSLSIGSAVAGSDILKSGDVDTMSQWYGRAGGLTDSDRVVVLVRAATSTQVGVTYDKDVAQRTNMPRDSAPNGGIGITYDKDVAERTNLPHGDKSAPIQTTGVSNK